MDFQKFITEFGRTLSIHLAFRWITAERGGSTVEFKLWTGDRPKYLESIGSWIPADNGELRGVLRCQVLELTEKDFAEVDFGTMISDVTDRTLEQKKLEEAAGIVRRECKAHNVFCPVDEFADLVRRTGYCGDQPQTQLFSKAAHHLREKHLLSVTWSVEPMSFVIRKDPGPGEAAC